MTYIKEIYGPLTKTTICLVMLKGIKPSTEEWDGYSIFSQNYLSIVNIVYKVTGINPRMNCPVKVRHQSNFYGVSLWQILIQKKN